MTTHTQSSNRTASSIERFIRGLLLVVFVVPTATSIVHGCSDEVDTACFYWPDPNRTDIDPKVCPDSAEAESMYLTMYTVTGHGSLEDGACCYSVTPKEEGCTGLGTIISAAPTQDPSTH